MKSSHIKVRRVLSLLLMVLIVAASLPFSAFAAENENETTYEATMAGDMLRDIDSGEYLDEQTVYLSELEHGQIEWLDGGTGPRVFQPGDEVEFKISSDENYDIAEFGAANMVDGTGVSMYRNTDKAGFTMPEGSIKVYAVADAIDDIMEATTTEEILEALDEKGVDVGSISEGEAFPDVVSYIRENLDTDYVTDSDEYSYVDLLNVRQSILDGTKVSPELTKISDLFRDETSVVDMIDSVMMQPEGSVFFYDFGSDWYVALANTMIRQDNFTVTDVQFAVNTDRGIMVDVRDWHYDYDTGLLYVKKETADKEIAERGYDAYRVQLLQRSVEELHGSDETIDVSLTVQSKNLGSEVAKSGTAQALLFNDYIGIMLAQNEKARADMADLNADDFMVDVNGVPVDGWRYEPREGMLYIDMYPGGIYNIDITVEGESLWSKIVGAFSMKASAAGFTKWETVWTESTGNAYIRDTGTYGNLPLYPSLNSIWDYRTKLQSGTWPDDYAQYATEAASWKITKDDVPITSADEGLLFHFKYSPETYSPSASIPISNYYYVGGSELFKRIKSTYLPKIGNEWSSGPDGELANAASLIMFGKRSNGSGSLKTDFADSMQTSKHVSQELSSWDVMTSGLTLTMKDANGKGTYKVKTGGTMGKKDIYSGNGMTVQWNDFAHYVQSCFHTGRTTALLVSKLGATGAPGNVINSEGQNRQIVNEGWIRVLRVEEDRMLIGIVSPTVNIQAGVGTYWVPTGDIDIPGESSIGFTLTKQWNPADNSLPKDGATFEVTHVTVDHSKTNLLDVPDLNLSPILQDVGDGTYRWPYKYTDGRVVNGLRFTEDQMEALGFGEFDEDGKFQLTWPEFTYEVAETKGPGGGRYPVSGSPQTGHGAVSLDSTFDPFKMNQITYDNTSKKLKVVIHKALLHPAVGINNDFYSLANAGFELTVSSGGKVIWPKNDATDGFATTDAYGMCEFREVPLGDFELRETSPTASGTYVQTNFWTGRIEDGGGEEARLVFDYGGSGTTIQNAETSGQVFVYKQDSDNAEYENDANVAQGDASLNGARFKFKFYPGRNMSLDMTLNQDPLFSFEADTTDCWIDTNGNLTATEPTVDKTKVALNGLYVNREDRTLKTEKPDEASASQYASLALAYLPKESMFDGDTYRGLKVVWSDTVLENLVFAIPEGGEKDDYIQIEDLYLSDFWGSLLLQENETSDTYPVRRLTYDTKNKTWSVGNDTYNHVHGVMLSSYSGHNQGTIDASTWKHKAGYGLSAYFGSTPENSQSHFLWPVGTVVVEEIGMSEGYTKMDRLGYYDGVGLDEKASFTENGGLVFALEPVNGAHSRTTYTAKYVAENQVIRGGVRIYKADADRTKTGDYDDHKQGDGDFAGCKVAVINKSKESVVVGGRVYEPDEVVVTLPVSADGMALYDPHGDALCKNGLPYGTYEVREVVGPMDDYDINSGWSVTFQIREQGKVVDANSYERDVLEQTIWRGGFAFQKVDGETILENTNGLTAQGDASFKDAEFEVVNESATDVYVNGAWAAPGEVCMTFKTDANGRYQSAANVLPVGSYKIREKTPSEGYLLNREFYADFQIRESGTIVNVQANCPEQVIRGDVQIEKFDQDLNRSETLGGKNHTSDNSGAHLAGVQFEITNVSKAGVMVDGTYYAPNSVVKIVTTEWDEEQQLYVARSLDKSLPYGTYQARELMTKDPWGNDLANPSYLVTAEGKVKFYTFEIRKDGTTVTTGWASEDTLDKNGDRMKVYTFDKTGEPETIHWDNKIVRGDFRFEKHAEDTSEPMETVWVVTNTTSGERHVIKTDKNGVFDSSAKYEGIPHSYLTNDNDRFLDDIDAGKALNIDDLKMTGIWFGLGEDGNPEDPTVAPHWVPVSDTEGAFPYGTYNVQEVRTDSNQGYGLIGYTAYIYYNGMVVAGGTHDDHPLSVSTVAVDSDTGIHTGAGVRGAKILDTVTYTGLDAGQKYTTRATLLNPDTGAYVTYIDENREPQRITGQTSFTAADSNGKVDVEISLDAAELAGSTIVVFEELFDAKGNFIGSHVDLHDLNQTVRYPKISTVAVNKLTGMHTALAQKNVQVVDTVKFENLNPGYNYTIKGQAIDLSNNKVLKDITAEKSFMPNKSNGTVDMDFKFDATELNGKTIVFYENLYYNGNLVATHSDASDTNQMISFPGLKTEATCEQTGSHYAWASSELKINDAVTYTGLELGEEYTLTAELIDAETEKPVEVNKKPVTGFVAFKAEGMNGTQNVELVFDASAMTGKTVVVFETLSKNGEVISEHKDLNDLAQTIYFPELNSTAFFTESGLKEASGNGNISVTEQLSYKNLAPGSEYTLVATLYDSASGERLMFDEMPVTQSIVFTPEESEGVVEIEFTFDSTDYSGHILVVCDELKQGSTLVAVHDDLTNVEQSVHFIGLRTVLTNDVTGSHLAQTEKETKLTDTVTVTSIVPGEEYELHGTLVRQDTGEAVTDEVVVKFKPENSEITVPVPFIVDTRKLGGSTVVAFESLYKNGVEIAVHNDINDESQSVRVPMITTQLVGTDTEGKNLAMSKAALLTDKVHYTNLIPNLTYKLTGSIISKASGKVLEYNGEPVEQVVTFTPVTADGTVDVKFSFDSTEMAGQYVVAFEELSVAYTKDGTPLDMPLTSEKNIDNADQTVRFVKPGEEPDAPVTDGPGLKTTAIGKNTGTRMIEVGEKAVIVDTVNYDKLTPGVEYTLTGTLVDKATGSAILNSEKQPVTVSKTFKPTAATGVEEMEFEVNTTELDGTSIVVFERLTKGEKLIVKHEDVNDTDQTVYVASLRTTLTARDGKSKEIKPGVMTLIDTVSFDKLVPGSEYTLKGCLVNKRTGDQLTDYVEMTFRPGSMSGSVQMTFELDGSEMNGETVVAYEYLTDSKDLPLASHADINDAAQSIAITSKAVSAFTGVNSITPIAIGTIVVLVLIAAGIGGYLVYKKRKFQNKIKRLK